MDQQSPQQQPPPLERSAQPPLIPPPAYAPCPQCKQQLASKVNYTMWGGFLGPRMMNLVECLHCHTRYNGSTGADASGGVALYVIVSVIIAVIIVAMQSY